MQGIQCYKVTDQLLYSHSIHTAARFRTEIPSCPHREVGKIQSLHHAHSENDLKNMKRLSQVSNNT